MANLFDALRDALSAVDKGLDPGDHGRAVIAQVDNIVSADRSITSYAPRTRRRLIAGARRGESAETANARERAQRRQRENNRGSRIDSLRDQINAAAGNAGIWDAADITDARETFGDPFVERALDQQLAALLAYHDGNSDLGRRHWQERDALMERYNVDPDDGDAVAFFYYHGSLN